MPETSMATGEPIDEYLDASANVKHFQTVRFAQLTVFIAVLAGLLSLLFRGSAAPPRYLATGIPAAGMLVTLLFWTLQERTMRFWRHFVARAAELEVELGFQQYRTLPRGRIVSGQNAMRGFFLIVMAFWIAALLFRR